MAVWYCPAATLYGTTAFGGIYWGTVFSLKTNGDDFSLLYRFGTLLISNNPADGNNPNGTLVLSGNTLYGAANQGGDSPYPGTGTVFSLDTSGRAPLRSSTLLARSRVTPTPMECIRRIKSY